MEAPRLGGSGVFRKARKEAVSEEQMEMHIKVGLESC